MCAAIRCKGRAPVTLPAAVTRRMAAIPGVSERSGFSRAGHGQRIATLLFALHHWAGLLVILIVLMHTGAALFHHVIRGDNVLRRMLPRALGGM